MQDDTPDTLPSARIGKNPPGTRAPIYASFLVCGIILGVLLTSAQFAGRPRNTAPESSFLASNAPSVQVEEKVTAESLPLVVSDQPSGPAVSISQLSLSQPTWVVVYASSNNVRGMALGARLFFAADSQGSVGLLRNTQAGQTYIIGLSVDNGDRIFSLSKDKPLLSADGNPLWETFRAQ